MERYLIRVRAWLLCIVAAVLGACQTATGGFDSLGSKPIEPVSAQTSLERGAAAVKRERWDEAVAHFGNAYRRNPYNPIVQFNYGLANAKAGNELVAIALFDTFIAAVPNAANRPRIERQIERLETAAEGKIARLFDLSEESIRKLPDGPIAQYDLSQRKWDLFHLIAWTQFEAGDQARARRNLATALRMVRAADPEAEQIDRQQIEWDRESYARESRNFGTGKFHWLYTIGNMQAEAEDFDAAFATLQKMADDHMSRREVQGSIFWRKISQTIAAGDLDGALRLSKPGSWKVALPVPKRTYFLYEYAASELSEALIKAGRVAEAMMLERSIAVSDRDSFLAGQIDDLFRAGYGKEARRQSSSLIRLAEESNKCLTMGAFAVIGRVSKALSMAVNLGDNAFYPTFAETCLTSLALSFTYAGDAAGAEKAAALARERAHPRSEGGGPRSVLATAYAEFAAGRVDRAIKTAKRAERDGTDAVAPVFGVQGVFPEHIVPFAASTGHPDVAEEVAKAWDVQPWLATIATGYAAIGKSADAARLREVIRLREEEKRAGWTAASKRHEARVAAWLRAVDRLLEDDVWLVQDDSILDIDKFVDKLKTIDPAEIPIRLAQAGLLWSRELVRLRALRNRPQS